MSDEKGFMIVMASIDASKKDALKRYLGGARPVFAAHGGKPLGQWAVASSRAGDSKATHIIVMEFPSTAAVEAVFADPAYLELVPARGEAFPVLDIKICTEFNPAALLGA